MIIATQLIFSLIFALSLSFVLSLFLRRKGPRKGFFFFFLIIFLITLAGGLWVKPFGPTLFGVFWLPIIIVGLLAGLILYQSAPRHPPHNREETLRMLQENARRKQLIQLTYVTLDILFWLIVCMLLVLIVYHIFIPL